MSERHFHPGLDEFVGEGLICSPEEVSEVVISELRGCDAGDWAASALLNLPQQLPVVSVCLDKRSTQILFGLFFGQIDHVCVECKTVFWVKLAALATC